MGRRHGTTVPTLPVLLNPALPNGDDVMQKENVERAEDLSPGQTVWGADQKIPGTAVKSHAAPPSCLVDAPHGTVRRNRHHLVPMQAMEDENSGAARGPRLRIPEQSLRVPALMPSPQDQVWGDPLAWFLMSEKNKKRSSCNVFFDV